MVTDEEALKSFKIYLTRFKLDELELTNLFFKALKVFVVYNLQTDPVLTGMEYFTGLTGGI